MATAKRFLIADKETGKQVYTNGQFVLSLSNDDGCTIPCSTYGTKKSIEKERKSIEKRLGREVILVESGTVNYFPI
jgi:hypothetical protein